MSCPGWLDGTDGAREKLGLLGGPQQVITPIAVLGFGSDRRLRVESLHGGASLDDVQQRTGFPIDAVDDLAETPPPTAEELEILRTRIDSRGVLRRERHG